jgi:cytochrome c oxidase assembly protein subunit 15
MIAAMNRLARFAWLVLGYNVLVILWGAVVRATGSGAGCGSHWPLCNGEVVPRGAAVATLIEFSHRLTSGVALLLVVALLVAVFRARPRGHAARRAAGWSMAFMVGEAAVGAMLVLFELVAENRSLARGLFMAVHLLNTFFLLGAIALTAHFAGSGRPLALRGRGREAALFAGGALLLLLTSVSGAVAALGDTLFPSQSLEEALRADLSATSHALIRLRVLHPFVAVGAAAYVVVVSLATRRRWAGAEIRGWSSAVAGLAVLQTVLGGLNVLLLAPVWMQVVHLLLADAVWIAFVLFGAVVLAERASATGSGRVVEGDPEGEAAAA